MGGRCAGRALPPGVFLTDASPPPATLKPTQGTTAQNNASLDQPSRQVLRFSPGSAVPLSVFVIYSADQQMDEARCPYLSLCSYTCARSRGRLRLLAMILSPHSHTHTYREREREKERERERERDTHTRTHTHTHTHKHTHAHTHTHTQAHTHKHTHTHTQTHTHTHTHTHGNWWDKGMVTTWAIALHNIPEGLAVALVAVPRGESKWTAASWAGTPSLLPP